MERYLPVRVIRCGMLENELVVRLPHGQYGYLTYDPTDWFFDIGDIVSARIYGKEIYKKGGIQRSIPLLLPKTLLEREEFPIE